MSRRPSRLRRVDPTIPPSRFARFYSRLATSRTARFISRHLSWKLDPILLGLTGGRIASTLVFPAAVLETVGARTGAPRRNAVIYFNDGERILIVASNAGAATHPGWYFNLLSSPDVIFAGVAMRATEVKDETECQRLSALADNVFPAFATYRRDALAINRTVPLIQLSPSTGGDARRINLNLERSRLRGSGRRVGSIDESEAASGIRFGR